MKKYFIGLFCTVFALNCVTLFNGAKEVIAESEEPKRDVDVAFNVVEDEIKQYESTSNPQYDYLLGDWFNHDAASGPFSVTASQENFVFEQKEKSTDLVALYVPIDVSLEVPAYKYTYEVKLSFSLKGMNIDSDIPLESSMFEIIELGDYYTEMPDEFYLTEDLSFYYGSKVACDNTKNPGFDGEITSILDCYNENDKAIDVNYRLGLFLFTKAQSDAVQTKYELTLDEVELTGDEDIAFRIVETDNYLTNDMFSIFAAPYIQNNQTLQLVRDVTASIPRDVCTKTVTIDLNGKTLTTGTNYATHSSAEITFTNGTIKGTENASGPLFYVYDGTIRVLNDVTVDMSMMSETSDQCLSYMMGGSLFLGAGKYILPSTKGCIFTDSYHVNNVYILNSDFVYVDSLDKCGLIRVDGNTNLYIIGPKSVSEIYIADESYSLNLYFDYNSISYTGNAIRVRFDSNLLPVCDDVLVNYIEENFVNKLIFTNLYENTYAKYDSTNEQLVLDCDKEVLVYFHMNDGTGMYSTCVVKQYSNFTVEPQDVYYAYHTFVGWYTDPEKGYKLDNQTILITKETHIQAVWKQTAEDKFNYFIGVILHFDDIETSDVSSTGKCLGNDGYFEIARRYYIHDLSLSNKELFNTSNDQLVVDARERFQTWANLNGYEIDYSNSNIIKRSMALDIFLKNNNQETNNGLYILLSIALIFTDVGVIFILRRRKHK